mmetsp:Transcript_204/g.410  ORF Transcript_204/g.410 Transcript_204/m.410 type:complete len:736 (-) Transcript_204:1111-3318(-)
MAGGATGGLLVGKGLASLLPEIAAQATPFPLAAAKGIATAMSAALGGFASQVPYDSLMMISTPPNIVPSNPSPPPPPPQSSSEGDAPAVITSTSPLNTEDDNVGLVSAPQVLAVVDGPTVVLTLDTNGGNGSGSSRGDEEGEAKTRGTTTQTVGKRSLAGVAGIVAAATLLSKVFGLMRQQAIAAAFGVGPAVNAFNYASVVPGFLLTLLGGINGPFHSAMVSVLAKHPEPEVAAPVVHTISYVVGAGLTALAVVLYVFAGRVVDFAAPGLGSTVEGLLTREIAMKQLRIMAPMAPLAGLIGVGFGTLSARDAYWLPSVSPILSSVTVTIALAFLAARLKDGISTTANAMLGGTVLAWSALAGAALQWLVQVEAQAAHGLGYETPALPVTTDGAEVRGPGFNLGFLKGVFTVPRLDFKAEGVREVLSLMGPATLSSGMSQIAVYVDLFFASYIPHGAAAALSYANLLIQTPLGVASSMLLVPLMPIYSRLAGPDGDRSELRTRIRQGLFLSALTMLPASTVLWPLALPLVRLVYERYAFDNAASVAVASALRMFGIGMFPSLGRDVLVRVFYAMGDGNTPFRISTMAIILNALLDAVLVKPLGAPGLVLATSAVNFIAMVALLFILHRRMTAEDKGLDLSEWVAPFVGVSACSVAAGLASSASLKLAQHFLGAHGFLATLSAVCISGTVGLAVFAAAITFARVPEVDMCWDAIRQKLRLAPVEVPVLPPGSSQLS